MYSDRSQLADQREIIYFDLHPQPGRAEDARELEPRGAAGKLRYDINRGDWVAIAEHRGSRTFLPSTAECPLCPSTDTQLTEIPSNYQVAVFENRFPSLGPDLGHLPEVDDGTGEYPAFGRCEVIAFTEDHTGSFAQLSQEDAELVMYAWAERSAELAGLEGIKQVFCFENRGEQIGVTLQHPHGQIYAYPYIPATQQVIAEQNLHYTHSHPGRTLLLDRLEQEREDGSRMIFSGEHVSAFVPYAARWPLEVMVVPHRRLGSLPELSEQERAEFALALRDVLTRVDHLYSSPTPYIASWMQAPLDQRYQDSYTLYWHLFSPRRAEDKLKFLAGSEAGMGAFVMDVSAEEVAQRLRSVPGVI